MGSSVDEMLLRIMIVKALRMLYSRGLISGLSGNVSARLPGRDAMIITPSGMHKAVVKPADLLVVSFTGEVLSGEGKPSIEWRAHREVYVARQDAVAVVHAHSPYTLAVARDLLECEYPEVRLGVGKLSLVPALEPGSPELAEAIGREFKSGANAVIMAKHGVIACGKDPLHAEARIEALEEVAKVIWLNKILRSVDALT